MHLITGGKLQIIPKTAQIVPVFDFKNWKIGRGTYGHVYKAKKKDGFVQFFN